MAVRKPVRSRLRTNSRRDNLSKKFTRRKIVEVYWFDAASNDSWRHITEVHETRPNSVLVRSIGYVVYKDNHEICLADTEDVHQKFGRTFTIPKSWIIKVVRK